jgi:hypothetical protein
LRVWATAALGGAGDARHVILAGDLNDTVQAATTQLLLGPPGSEISPSKRSYLSRSLPSGQTPTSGAINRGSDDAPVVSAFANL